MSVCLPSSEYQLYYKLHFSLLFFVKTKQHILKSPDLRSWKDFQDNTTLEQKQKVRDFLYKNISLIDRFIQENPQKFIQAELKMIDSWKHFIQGKFYIIQYLKGQAIFLSTQKTEKAYGVKALQDEFDVILPYDPPILVEAVLLPFKEYIVYDGMLFTTPIIFGAGIRRDLQQSYQEAKARFGIITSLSEAQERKEPDKAELLRFYVKNEKNREYYAEEISDLLGKHPSLFDVYHQEMGKAYARSFVRTLHEIGIKNKWFATIKGVIIASGASKKEVENNFQKIIPQQRKNHVYVFQVK